jgi:hypothetical protein
VHQRLVSRGQRIGQQPQHDDYEKDRVEACFRRLIDRWAPRLQGANRFLRSHCWRMIVGQAIDLTPQ